MPGLLDIQLNSKVWIVGKKNSFEVTTAIAVHFRWDFFFAKPVFISWMEVSYILSIYTYIYMYMSIAANLSCC